MPINFQKKDEEEIIRLSKEPDLEANLYKFTFGELQILNEEIEIMSKKYQDDLEIFSELMRLKNHSIHIANFAKKRDQNYI